MDPGTLRKVFLLDHLTLPVDLWQGRVLLGAVVTVIGGRTVNPWLAPPCSPTCPLCLSFKTIHIIRGVP